jgi:hypothetical protein
MALSAPGVEGLCHGTTALTAPGVEENPGLSKQTYAYICLIC